MPMLEKMAPHSEKYQWSYKKLQKIQMLVQNKLDIYNSLTMTARTIDCPSPACSSRPSARPDASGCGVTSTAARGFGLVEVLVAIVVLTIAMLGTVAMQAFALQANRNARLHAQPVVLAHELAQATNAQVVATARSATGNAPYLVSSLTIENPNCCLRVANAASGCANTTDMARAEMIDWLTRVTDELSGARVRVCFDTAPHDANDLAQWDCTADADTNHIAYIKTGWTRASTDRSKAGAAAPGQAADDHPPAVVLPAVVDAR